MPTDAASGIGPLLREGQFPPNAVITALSVEPKYTLDRSPICPEVFIFIC